MNPVNLVPRRRRADQLQAGDLVDGHGVIDHILVVDGEVTVEWTDGSATRWTPEARVRTGVRR